MKCIIDKSERSELFMNMNMRLKENGSLHEKKKLVQLIRGLEENEIALAAKFLKEDEELIRKILNIIDEHPEMDDEEIASEFL